MAESPVLFSPDNEPYLGRKPLYVLDTSISSAMKTVEKIAPLTLEVDDDQLKKACLDLVPGGISLALSIRELIRQAHLYSAYVLTRPLAERAFTSLYLFHNHQDLPLWKKGWPYNERPRLAEIMRRLDAKGVLGTANPLNGLNSLIHGDPSSSQFLLFEDEEGEIKISLSRNLLRPDICNDICSLTISFIAILMGVASGTFGLGEKVKPC